jgi:putative addiction module component
MHTMSQDTHSEFDRILRVAMKLSPEARAALAGSLLESLDDTLDEGAEAAWEVEVAHRTQELDSAVAKPIAWSQARRSILGR